MADLDSPGDGLSATSRRYLAERDPGERKALGQYLTPRLLREPLLDRIPLAPGMAVLDPGVGTGEFLASARDRCPGLRLVGWDIDPQVLRVAAELVPEAELVQRSAFEVEPREEFDVVVGNPPYFQLRLDPAQRRRFAPVISGRPNIFALFLQVGLEMLKPGGLLGFVVPPSMNHGAYFQALRDHIAASGTIEHLEVFTDAHLFAGAQTAVQLLVVRKGTPSRRHIFDLQEATGGPVHRTVFCEDPTALYEAFEGRSTLWDLGYRAVTGTIVWNQSRERLRQEPGPDTVPLIWAHNLAEDRIVPTPDHPTRPQYVVERAPLTGPAIVANRVVGAVGTGSIRCALVADGEAFVGENHVNVVLCRDDVDPLVGWDTLLELLQAPGVNKHVVRLTGNTQISATELTHLLPLAHPGRRQFLAV